MRCFKFLKIMMFGISFIILLGGCAVLGVGMRIKKNSKFVRDLLAEMTPDLQQVVQFSDICIAIGSFLIIVAFLGSLGTSKENKYILLTFFIIILLIFIAQVAGAAIILVFSDWAYMFMRYIEIVAMKTLKEVFGKIDEITYIWKDVMDEFKCCAINGYQDLTYSFYYNDTSSRYPDECCDSVLYCYIEEVDRSLPGCYKVLLDYLKSNTMILGQVALGIGILEIGAMAASMTMYCQMQKLAKQK